jgi:hypothetical protein
MTLFGDGKFCQDSVDYFPRRIWVNALLFSRQSEVLAGKLLFGCASVPVCSVNLKFMDWQTFHSARSLSILRRTHSL